MRTGAKRGYSLIELLIVIVLVGLIAAIAIPAFDSNDEVILDRAAAEVASAFRFAHAEAIRTGQPYGVIANDAAQTVRVYRLDESVDPPIVVYDVYDPFTKQPYDLAFSTDNSAVEISSSYFKFEGMFSPLSFVGFAGESGVPKYNDSGTIRMLDNGYIRLGLNGLTRTVAVAPMTGRVTVQ